MKTFLKTIAWIIGIPLSIVLIFVLLGFLAIRFDFWPPNCNVLPVQQAKRVCEFSKLEKAPLGQPAKVTLWVTVQYNTPQSDKVFFAVDGKAPIQMDRLSSTSFQIQFDATTGDTLKYRYLRNSDKSVSDEKQFAVKSFEKKVYDYVSKWSDLDNSINLSRNILPGIDMMDTWTINYNFNMFEDTRRNLDSAMERVKTMGGKEFGVYSFIDMAGDRENFTVTETASPYYHWRDAAITEKEMAKIAKTAKKYGLKTVLHYNVGADYNKYLPSLNPLNIFNPVASGPGQGTGGEAAEQKAGADFGRDEPKTKAWLDREFAQFETILLKWAKSAEKAGIDAIDITPQYRMPTAKPEFDYADAKYRDIIKEIREIYHGKIYGSNFNSYGGLRSAPPQFINDIDALFIYVAPIAVRPNASIAEMRSAHAAFLDKVESELANYSKPIYLVIVEQSYEGVTNGKPGTEFSDYAEAIAAGYKENWQEQADSYEAFFQALNGRTKFAGVRTGSFWFDDFMAPKYMDPLNNMKSTIRNKPAEAVWKKWVLPLTR